MGKPKKLTPWRQEMAEFTVALTSDEWEALKTAGQNSTARMQHVLREALCFYLATNKEDFANLPVLMLEKNPSEPGRAPKPGRELDELQNEVEKTIAEKEQSGRQD